MVIAKAFRWVIQVSCFGLLFCIGFAFAEHVDVAQAKGGHCQRIVSISPALSDMMAELDLDENVIGATRYCKLPYLAERQIVGGYFDLNFEKVASLKPDIVFLEGAVHNPVANRLDELGIKNRVFPLDTLDEMESAKNEIALYCDGVIVSEEQTLRAELATYVPEKAKHERKPRVLILYNYGDNAAKILPRLAAGRSFHGELLDALRMENVYVGSLNAPELTREAIALLNPEWIFILNSLVGDPNAGREILDVERIAPKWEFLAAVDAVYNDQVYEIRGFYTQIPSVAAMRKLGHIFASLVYQDSDSLP